MRLRFGALLRPPVMFAVLSLIIVFIPFSVYAAEHMISESHISRYGIEQTVGRVNVTGELPSVSGLVNIDAERNLNWRVEDFVRQKTEDAPGKVRTVEFSYETKESDEYFTLMIFCDATDSDNVTDKSALVLNIDVKTLDLADIYDAGGPNIVRIINKVIADEAKRTPGKYNSRLQAVDGDRNFYLEDGNLVVLFDDLEVSPRRAKRFTLSLDLDKLKETYKTKDEYRLADGSKIQLLMLKILDEEGFGYKLVWIDGSRKVEVYFEGEFVGALTMGQNTYELRGTKKKLEAPPEVYEDSRTYVPITFFSEVLGMAVNMDEDGTLCISDYRE